MVNLFSLDALTIDWQSVLQTAQKESTDRIPFIFFPDEENWNYNNELLKNSPNTENK